MNDNEKIENLEKEIQSLKGIIDILSKDAKFSPVKAATTPERPPVEVFEETEEITEEVIDISSEEYDPEEFDIEDGLLHEYLGESKEVTIPYGVRKIDNGAFKNNQKVKKINFPETVVEIGTQSFANCNGLVEVNMPQSLKIIGNEAFSECINLVTVNISGKNIIIGSKAFSECISLKNINIENVQEVYDRAFYSCTSLTRLRFSENTKRIGDAAFRDCINLRISVPETCTWYHWSFDRCKNVVIREVLE